MKTIISRSTIQNYMKICDIIGATGSNCHLWLEGVWSEESDLDDLSLGVFGPEGLRRCRAAHCYKAVGFSIQSGSQQVCAGWMTNTHEPRGIWSSHIWIHSHVPLHRILWRACVIFHFHNDKLSKYDSSERQLKMNWYINEWLMNYWSLQVALDGLLWMPVLLTHAELEHRLIWVLTVSWKQAMSCIKQLQHINNFHFQTAWAFTFYAVFILHLKVNIVLLFVYLIICLICC